MFRRSKLFPRCASEEAVNADDLLYGESVVSNIDANAVGIYEIKTYFTLLLH
jgi:hypothetical protein